MKTSWVNCPICGCSDMRQTEDSEGNKLINCTNHACKSNGGEYQIRPQQVCSHFLSREYKGSAESRTITPICSCGWVGRTVYQYQNTPIMDIIYQESDHIKNALSQSENMKCVFGVIPNSEAMGG